MQYETGAAINAAPVSYLFNTSLAKLIPHIYHNNSISCFVFY